MSGTLNLLLLPMVALSTVGIGGPVLAAGLASQPPDEAELLEGGASSEPTDADPQPETPAAPPPPATTTKTSAPQPDAGQDRSQSAPYVLALGVNDPGIGGLNALLYADDDAAEAVTLFGAPERAQLLTIMDAQTQRRYPALAKRAQVPSRASLERAIAQIAAGVTRDLAAGLRPTVLVWISGHAAYGEDGHPYLPLSGGQLSADQLLDEIVQPLAKAHRVHLVIDTCFASALVKARAVVEDASAQETDRAFLQRSLGGLENVGLLAGSTATNRAYEWAEIGGGVFSAMVRAGLRGAADVNGDDAVSYPELSAFLAAAARDVAAEEARPRVRVLAPAIEADAALIQRRWLGRIGVLEADLSQLGTIHVLDESGAWLLAGAFESGHEPRLWLPRGRRLFLRSGDVDHQLVEGAYGFSLGPAAKRATRARSLVDTALREGLFRRPFGPAFFGGFTAFSLAEGAPIRRDSATQVASRAGSSQLEAASRSPSSETTSEDGAVAIDDPPTTPEGAGHGENLDRADQAEGISWFAIATLSGAAAVGGVLAASGVFFVLSAARFSVTDLERQAAWELNNAMLFGAVSAGALVICGALLGGGAVLLVVE